MPQPTGVPTVLGVCERKPVCLSSWGVRHLEREQKVTAPHRPPSFIPLSPIFLTCPAATQSGCSLVLSLKLPSLSRTKTLSLLFVISAYLCKLAMNFYASPPALAITVDWLAQTKNSPSPPGRNWWLGSIRSWVAKSPQFLLRSLVSLRRVGRHC